MINILSKKYAINLLVLIVISFIGIGGYFSWSNERKKNEFIQSIVVGKTEMSQVVSVLGAPKFTDTTLDMSLSSNLDDYENRYVFIGTSFIISGHFEDYVVITFDKFNIVTNCYRVGL